MKTLGQEIKRAQASKNLSGPYLPLHELFLEEIMRLRKLVYLAQKRKGTHGETDPGAPAILAASENAQLITAVRLGLPLHSGLGVGGGWTGPLIVKFVEREFKATWSDRTAQRFLKTYGPKAAA